MKMTKKNKSKLTHLKSKQKFVLKRRKKMMKIMNSNNNTGRETGKSN